MSNEARYSSERQVCRDALYVVDSGASNPLGVARSLWDMLCYLRRSGYEGPLGKHPAVILVWSQLQQLLRNPRIDDTETFRAAYDYCVEHGKEKKDA